MFDFDNARLACVAKELRIQVVSLLLLVLLNFIRDAVGFSRCSLANTVTCHDTFTFPCSVWIVNWLLATSVAIQAFAGLPIVVSS